MSAVVEAVVAVAMFLAIGGDTEENMKNMLNPCDEQILNCDVDKSKPVISLWPTPEVKQLTWSESWGNKRECDRNAPAAMTQADLAARNCIPERHLNTWLRYPEWVPADQPTQHGWDGYWWKLRL